VENKILLKVSRSGANFFIITKIIIHSFLTINAPHDRLFIFIFLN